MLLKWQINQSDSWNLVVHVASSSPNLKRGLRPGESSRRFLDFAAGFGGRLGVGRAQDLEELSVDRGNFLFDGLDASGVRSGPTCLY